MLELYSHNAFPSAFKEGSMQKIKSITSHVVPLLLDDVDTDQIIPARFLKTTIKDGLGEYLFTDWRYHQDGSPNPEFVLNQPHAAGARILLAGANFGCGSSREHAPWALIEWGIHAVIALSFADIFHSNALKNGLIPVELDAGMQGEIARLVHQDPSVRVTVDLLAKTVSLPDGRTASFPIDPFARHCLLDGIDQLGYLRSFSERILAYEVAHDNT
jgi:3-isopropylmalate/(R)-2-methylmalate dehydratase small subunit